MKYVLDKEWTKGHGSFVCIQQNEKENNNYHLQWWSNCATHLLQTLQCLVREFVVFMLHKWHRPFSMTCACFVRSNSGTMRFELCFLSSESDGSISRAATCEHPWITYKLLTMRKSGACKSGCKAGIRTQNVDTPKPNNATQPLICSGCNGNWSPLIRRPRSK